MPNKFHQDIVHQNKTRGFARCKINHGDLTAAALTESKTWAALVAANGGSSPPANARIVDCWINLRTAFSGGTVDSCVIDVGDAADPDELLSAIDIFTGASSGITVKDGVYALDTFESGYTPLVAVTTTTGNVVALSAGSAEIVIEYEAISADAYL
jgi:hypothetical protein